MRKLIAFLVASVVVMIGCAKREPQIVGKWEPAPDPFTEDLPAEQKSKLDAMILKMSLEFRADKTYTLTMAGAGRTNHFDGVYVLRGHRVTMTTTSLDGIDSKHLIQGEDSTSGARRQGPMQPWNAVLSNDSERLTLYGFGPGTKFIRAR